MIIMLGGTPIWACDRCYQAFQPPGVVLYEESHNARTHFPAAQTLCGPVCESAFIATQYGPVRRVPWDAFVTSLLKGEGGRP